MLDYASSFGTVALSRAYADWSVPVNSGYQKQLINRAVELVQLFPLTAQMKNGADIRLSVDVMEDLFRLPDLTHVVIVAGTGAAAPHKVSTAAATAGSSPTAKESPTAAVKQSTTRPKKVGAATADTATTAAAEQPAAKISPLKLLVRALRLVQQKEDSDWLNSSAVKTQMLRIDPSFDESSLKFRTFSDFVTSLNSNVEMREHEGVRQVRLRPNASNRS